MKHDLATVVPVSASSLPWQNSSIQHLVRLKHAQKLPHGILIEIKTLVDSSTYGWQLATALLCKNPLEDLLPCGDCQHCELMRANNYPDFTYTTLIENERTQKPNKDIKIEQIRRLIHQLSLTPSLDGGKIALIYPAEKMNQSAANSLLKTLEEPAENSTLILLTHNTGRLPITIRSRCQLQTVENPVQAVAQQWLKQQNLTPAEIDEYLEFSHADAQLALQLQQQDYLQNLTKFRQLIKQYLGNEIEVITVFNGVKSLDSPIIRLMIKNTLGSFLYRQLEKSLSLNQKKRILSLLDLIKHSNFILQIEENNLNFQLQLEDVLISLKQILNRGNHNAGTKPGDIVSQH
jgi:DNA polymerase-3 subunit delta'